MNVYFHLGEGALVDEDAWKRAASSFLDMQQRLIGARTEDDFKTIGLIGREVLIALGQAVFDPAIHKSDVEEVSRTDAKRMLDAYIAVALPGHSNEQIRRLARSAVALAQALQHDQAPTSRDAELVVIATESVFRIVEVLESRKRHDAPWSLVEIAGRFFAWEGPVLHSLPDRPGIPEPAGLIDALREAGVEPSYALTEKLGDAFAKGRHQVFETDLRSWRRPILYKGAGNQVLVARTVHSRYN
jgi:hypothetical protein